MSEKPVIMMYSQMVEANGKTVRENNMELQHKYPIDTLVEVKYDTWHGEGACTKIHARLFVARHIRDCDGTPLYILSDTPTKHWIQHPSEVFFTDHKHPLRDVKKEWIFRGMYRLTPPLGESCMVAVEQTSDLVKGYGALSWEDENV